MKLVYTSFDKETGAATCVFDSKYGNIVGTAQCHPDDKDMCSELTGTTIAAERANRKYLQLCKVECKGQLAALNQLYYSMKHSSNFNPKSYENKMLQRQIRFIEDDLATIKQMLSDSYRSLKKYIDEKEKFYTKLRTLRKAQNHEV